MEIKNNQLTIKIPEGMKVDVEKSNLKAGVIKFRKKEICYADVLSTLADKDIDSADIKVPEIIAGKIIALARLMTIAKSKISKTINSNLRDFETKILREKLVSSYYFLLLKKSDFYIIVFNSKTVNFNI